MEEVLTSVTLRYPPFLEKILENNNKQNNQNSNNNSNEDKYKMRNNKTISNTVYEEIARLKGTVKSRTVKKGKSKNTGNEVDEDKKGLQNEEVRNT